MQHLYATDSMDTTVAARSQYCKGDQGFLEIEEAKPADRYHGGFDMWAVREARPRIGPTALHMAGAVGCFGQRCAPVPRIDLHLRTGKGNDQLNAPKLSVGENCNDSRLSAHPLMALFRCHPSISRSQHRRQMSVLEDFSCDTWTGRMPRSAHVRLT